MDFDNSQTDRRYILREYYARYLTEVRGLSKSSVNHYFDALNNISRRLTEKGLVERDIYEITELDYLEKVRSILYADPDFVELNERGKRMYSAGLNNYLRFAKGEGFEALQERDINPLDIPVAPEKSIIVEQMTWKRSSILRTQAFEIAGYMCEMDSAHISFITETTGKPYMEGHHALPMKSQGCFDVSLDVYANIICLCPICHRKIHHGLKCDRIEMAKKIYCSRNSRLEKAGIVIPETEFVEIAAGV